MKKRTSQTFSIKYSKLEELEKLCKKHDKKLSQIINEAIDLWIEKSNNHNNQKTISDQRISDLVDESETKQETKPDTEQQEPLNPNASEIAETYRDMESFFNSKPTTKPSSFDEVNWDFD